MAKSHPGTVLDENAHNLGLLGQENVTVKKAVSPFFMKPAQSFILSVPIKKWPKIYYKFIN
jgi:hypothetical protein